MHTTRSYPLQEKEEAARLAKLRLHRERQLRVVSRDDDVTPEQSSSESLCENPACMHMCICVCVGGGAADSLGGVTNT